MSDIRLIALDLDGTVFNDQKEITPRTMAAIRAAIAILGDRSSILGYVSVELCDKLVRVNAVDHACLSDCLVPCGGAAEAVHTHLDEIGRKGAVGVKEFAYLHIFCDLFHGKCFLSFLRCADLDPQYHYTTAF